MSTEAELRRIWGSSFDRNMQRVEKNYGTLANYLNQSEDRLMCSPVLNRDGGKLEAQSKG